MRYPWKENAFFILRTSSPRGQVDGMRVECVLRSFAANAAEILPLQRPARTLLPPLLLCMACEMLGVRVLAPEVRLFSFCPCVHLTTGGRQQTRPYQGT